MKYLAFFLAYERSIKFVFRWAKDLTLSGISLTCKGAARQVHLTRLYLIASESVLEEAHHIIDGVERFGVIPPAVHLTESSPLREQLRLFRLHQLPNVQVIAPAPTQAPKRNKSNQNDR